MPKLPVVSGEKAIKAFEKIGYVRARQKGSHVSLKKAGAKPFPVPLHKELKDGTLRRMIAQAGLTVEKFCELL